MSFSRKWETFFQGNEDAVTVVKPTKTMKKVNCEDDGCCCSSFGNNGRHLDKKKNLISTALILCSEVLQCPILLKNQEMK